VLIAGGLLGFSAMGLDETVEQIRRRWNNRRATQRIEFEARKRDLSRRSEE
jgi:hypothetical protein